jgi:N-acetylmuramoyl-L-alanine amidase
VTRRAIGRGQFDPGGPVAPRDAHRSIRLADLILREGQGPIRFHRDPRREAAFVVLKSLDLPSALMEAGYVSNADDAGR